MLESIITPKFLFYVEVNISTILKLIFTSTKFS